MLRGCRTHEYADSMSMYSAPSGSFTLVTTNKWGHAGTSRKSRSHGTLRGFKYNGKRVIAGEHDVST